MALPVKRRFSIGVLILMLTCTRETFGETWKLLGDFNSNWRQSWNERKFTHTPTEYKVTEDSGKQVLKGVSDKSASGLWRMIQIQPVSSGTISWNWKVQHSLTGNQSERKKKGDDYAARVFVVFEPHFLSWKTRSVCYVWAGQEPVGSIFPSPYADNVAMIVLESGDQRAGQWISEKRDFVSDYKRFFGEPPKSISAVAIMIDTDNTSGSATAYFTDLLLTIP